MIFKRFMTHWFKELRKIINLEKYLNRLLTKHKLKEKFRNIMK